MLFWIGIVLTNGLETSVRSYENKWSLGNETKKFLQDHDLNYNLHWNQQLDGRLLTLLHIASSSPTVQQILTRGLLILNR